MKQKNDFHNPQEIYITCDIYNKYKIFFDEPILKSDGKFYSKNGQWTDLLDYRWGLDLEKGTYIKFVLDHERK